MAWTTQFNRILIRTAVERSSLISFQSVRHKASKKGILVHRKPRWIPTAKSKLFRLPPVNHIPADEADQLDELYIRYESQMAALTQYLYEDYLKNSDVGEAGAIEHQKEEEEHARLIAENEQENQRIAKLRADRLVREAKEENERIQKEIALKEEMEKHRIKEVDEFVRAETEAFANFIKPENVEKAIEEALSNPVDYEYAIDKEGHIFYGRYTKSVLVPKDQLEKIPVPVKEVDLLATQQKN